MDALARRGVAAHRGGAALAPENTLAAFRAAAEAGAHQLEFDVRRTADGELVVIHDAHVDRTTDGRGPVASLSLSELRRLDAGGWMHDRFAGERIPTLREALACQPRDLWINVQIKQGEPIAAEVVRLIAEADRVHQAFVACGNAAAREARRACPEILVCNLARGPGREEYVERAAATRADFVQLHWLRGPPEPDLVRRAHDAGLRVNYFCEPSGAGLPALFEAGVDFALVDDVPRALLEARGSGIEPISR